MRCALRWIPLPTTNVGPFSPPLIQRLVCSNPSPAYIARVASVFNNNGKGVRGDLQAVIKVILLDDEGVVTRASQPAGWGKLRDRCCGWRRWRAPLALPHRTIMEYR